jgi:GNAT superfamily N-acetyltransferase|uniref:Alpha-tubulin N-acetyltransferase 1 n=1 Tax=Myoviridae sp. ctshb19 TaxID=2825194 RepID=A0A8S5UGD0_9CAUD|nr:MAG TPA: alpha-tubulin N-acetyltransferase 1 [Myoviridae sp. ctshb19]
MIRYHVYQGTDLQFVVPELIQQQIYDKRGDELLSVWERVAKTGTNNGRKVLVVVAEEKEPPLHARDTSLRVTFHGALMYEINRSHMQIYVRPTSRRKGVGSALVSRLRDYENYDRRVISAESGYPGSEQFFERNLIYVPDYSFGEEEIKQVNGELARAGKDTGAAPFYEMAIRTIIRRRKRKFLARVLKAQEAGKI